MATVNNFLWEVSFNNQGVSVVSTMTNEKADALDAALKLKEGTTEKNIVSIDFIKELVIVI